VVQVYGSGEQRAPTMVMEFNTGETAQTGLNGMGPLEHVGPNVFADRPARSQRGWPRRNAHGPESTANIQRRATFCWRPGGHTGHAKITDFGLARGPTDDASIFQARLIARHGRCSCPGGRALSGPKLDQGGPTCRFGAGPACYTRW